MDLVVAGAILADVGKLLESEVVDGTVIDTVYQVEPQSQLVRLVG